jgi:hypothetical protein
MARTFGCARVVFNDCLRLREACRAAGEKISGTEVQRRVITLAKLTPEREWLGEVLQVREWQCTACGTIHDRDVNAARDVLALGRRESLNARGGQVRPAATLAPASEAGTHRSAA